MELFLKGLLQTGLAHLGVHGVAVQGLVVFPLLAAHGTHITQQMGGVGGVVLTDGGCLDVHAGDVQFLDGGQILVRGVFQEDVVGQVDDGAQAHFIAQTDDGTGLLVRPVIGNKIAFTQVAQQQVGGNIRV